MSYLKENLLCWKENNTFHKIKKLVPRYKKNYCKLKIENINVGTYPRKLGFAGISVVRRCLENG